MATTHRNQLKKLCTHLATGTPRGSAAPGISADLAVHDARAGGLERLAHGVYRRPNDPPALHPSVALLQRTFEGLHVGGKSALDWHGIRHFVSQRPILHLYGWKAGGLPGWFTQRFPGGVRRPLQEARELVESSYSLRADVLRDLLKRCASVKTVRLCLQLGRELSQPWFGNTKTSRQKNPRAFSQHSALIAIAAN